MGKNPHFGQKVRIPGSPGGGFTSTPRGGAPRFPGACRQSRPGALSPLPARGRGYKYDSNTGVISGRMGPRAPFEGKWRILVSRATRYLTGSELDPRSHVRTDAPSPEGGGGTPPTPSGAYPRPAVLFAGVWKRGVPGPAGPWRGGESWLPERSPGAWPRMSRPGRPPEPRGPGARG